MAATKQATAALLIRIAAVACLVAAIISVQMITREELSLAKAFIKSLRKETRK